jgi:hypothetical protein
MYSLATAAHRFTRAICSALKGHCKVCGGTTAGGRCIN